MSILTYSTWFINIVFLWGLVPQLLLNFKLKSTHGLSDLTLFACFNGYIAFTYYIFCFNLPLAYKIMVPISLVLMLLMLVQRFAYHPLDKKLLLVYVINVFLVLLLAPYAYRERLIVGNIMGWINVLIWSVYQLPQLVKVHVSKSVLGFSFGLLTLFFLGELTELIVGICLQFPIQTIFNGLRGILIYIVFCIQFLLYRKSATS